MSRLWAQRTQRDLAPRAVRSAAVASALVVASLIAAPLSEASAAPAPPEDGRDRAGRIIRTSPALDGVDLYSPTYERLSKQHAELRATLAADAEAIATAGTRIAQATADLGAVQALSERAEIRRAKVAERLDALDEMRRALVVQRYTTDRLGDLLDTLFETPEEGLTRLAEQRVLSHVSGTVSAQRSSVSQRRDAIDADLDEWHRRAVAANVEITQSSTTSDAAESNSVRVQRQLTRVERSMDAERPNTLVNNSDMPFVALDAYWRASGLLAMAQPQCGIEWWLLAGVGRTESNHGRSGGATMAPDGTLSVPIIGIALDGTNNTRAIGDTDGGILDGDIVWDRAVGPMQFIPGTWNRWAVDASGDGVANPHNMYDATLAAGRLLCSGGPLDTPESLRVALRRYNNSDAYVDLVLNRAMEYTQLEVPAVGALPDPAAPQ